MTRTVLLTLLQLILLAISFQTTGIVFDEPSITTFRREIVSILSGVGVVVIAAVAWRVSPMSERVVQSTACLLAVLPLGWTLGWIPLN